MSAITQKLEEMQVIGRATAGGLKEFSRPGAREPNDEL